MASEYWENREEGKRGQGELPSLSKTVKDGWGIGRKKDRAERFSREGRHLANGATNDNLGRMLNPTSGRLLSEHPLEEE